MYLCPPAATLLLCPALPRPALFLSLDWGCSWSRRLVYNLSHPLLNAQRRQACSLSRSFALAMLARSHTHRLAGDAAVLLPTAQLRCCCAAAVAAAAVTVAADAVDVGSRITVIRDTKT